MDKKGIIAVTLSILVMVIWQIQFAPKYAPPRTPVAMPSPSPMDAAASAIPTPAPDAAPAIPSAPTAPSVEEMTEKVSSPSVEYTFTNLGGGIARANLLKHRGEQNQNVVLTGSPKAPIGAISEKVGEETDAPYRVTANPALGEVLCERETPRQLAISKKFTLPKDADGSGEYLIDLEVSFRNAGAQPYQSPGWFVHLGRAVPIHQADLPTDTSFNWYSQGNLHSKDVAWFGEGRIPLLGIQTSAEKTSYTEQLEKITWAGLRSQYFTTILTSPDSAGSGIWTARFPMPALKDAFGIEGALGLPPFTLAPGEVKTTKFTLWIGPKEYDKLKRLGQQQDEIMKFGMFKWVSEFLLASMNWLNSILGGYALAIIVLTICIRSAMWPLVNKSTQSMKKMQAVQPKMTELREKYKDDPTRMNTELMKLYKDYGINPFGGCVPMLLQIPIFFGFYAMLGTAIELRNSQFLWVNDLSQPDTVFHIAGFPVNILPLLMAGTMLWQMQLTPKTGDPVQQRIFMFVPLIFIVFCYNYASALALYWTVQNLFSIVQLYVTRDQTAPVLQKVSAPAKRRK